MTHQSINPSTQRPNDQRLHLPFIDGIRALAALFVVVCHAYYEPTNGFYTERWVTRIGLSYGHMAVVVFIVVSGFCLMLPIAQRGDQISSISAFYRRRIQRILPPYYAALALSVLFILTVAHAKTGTVWDNTLPLTVPRILANLFLIHNLPLEKMGIPGGNINYPLWSIASEFQIYLIMPLIVLTIRKYGEKFALLWTTAFGVGLVLIFGLAVYPATPWFVALFTMGAVAARQFVGRTDTPSRTLWLVCYGMGVLGIAAALLAGNKLYYANWLGFDLWFGATTALLLFLLSTEAASTARRSLLMRLLSWRPLVAIGVFSYSLYLIHAPAHHLHYLILNKLLHPRPIVMFGLLVLCIPLVIGWAYLFFLLFERPFLVKKNKNAPLSNLGEGQG